MAFLPTNASQVQQFAVALYGIQVGSATMSAVQADITAVGGLNKALNAYYTASFGSSTTAAVAASVAANLGLTGTAATDAAAYITAVLNGTAASARGEAILNVLNLFSTLTSNATFGTAATAWNTKVAAAVAYTGAADTVVASGSAVVGSTFALTAGIDAIVGTANDDEITANVAVNPANGVASIETLTALDTVNGGAGNDTLTYITVGATAFPAATISGVETIKMVSDGAATLDLSVASVTGVTSAHAQATGGAVAVTGKSNLTNVVVTGTATTVAVDDSGAAGTDTITSVSVTGNTGAVSIGAVAAVDTLNTLSLKDTNQDATITAAAGTRALTLNLNNVTGGVLTDGEATSLTVNSSGTKSSGLTLAAAKATGVTVNAAVATTIADVTIAAAKSLTVTGAGATTVTALQTVTALTSIDATGSTGGLTVTASIAAGVGFAGGAGKDSVALVATTKAITTGAGDDTVKVVGVDAFGTGGSADAGEGTDTLNFDTYAKAVSASAATTFEGTVSNFERLEVSGANGTDGATINLANLDDISYVTYSATNTKDSVISNMASGGTVAIKINQTAGEGVVVSVKDAATGTADSLNLVLSKATALATVEVTAADVETINITSTETATTLLGSVTHAATLSATSATSLNVTGNAGVTLGTLTGATKLASIDASGVSTGLVSFTTAALTTAATIKGGAGANTVVASAATKAVTYTGQDKVDTITINNALNNVVNTAGGADVIVTGSGADTINAGAGDDAITSGTGLDIISGGAGNDTFNIVAPTNGNTYVTITDINAGDIISVADQGTETFATTKIALADTALFADYLAASTAGDGAANGAWSWFQFGGNTYLVQDNDATAAFVNGTDIIVKLSGLVDLSTATGGTTAAITIA